MGTFYCVLFYMKSFMSLKSQSTVVGFEVTAISLAFIEVAAFLIEVSRGHCTLNYKRNI